MKTIIALFTLTCARYIDQSEYNIDAYAYDSDDGAYESTYETMPLKRSSRDLIGYNHQRNIASNVYRNLLQPFDNEDRQLEAIKAKKYKLIAKLITKTSKHQRKNILKRFKKRLLTLSAEIRAAKTIQRLKMAKIFNHSEKDDI